MERHASKIVVAVRGDLAVWQKLNVVAFMASGIAARHPELIGAAYADASGNAYLPLFGLPVMCMAGDAAALSRVRERAQARGLSVAVYTGGMFATGNDNDNRAVVAALAADRLDLVGLALCGDRKDVDKAAKGPALHT